MEEAFVSVVIPTYNRAAALERAVRSVLEQTYSKLEVIVVDDGSTDNTRQVVESIQDPRLHYLWQRNCGACAARNYGALHAKGEYIAFHDSDDIWHPDKLEKQMAAMQAQHADIIVCKMAMHRQGGRVTLYPKRIRQGFVTAQDDLFGIGTQTIVAKAEVLAQEPFYTDLPRYQDLEWIYRARQKFSIYYLDEPLVDYRIGSDSISKSPEKMFRALVLMQQLHPNIRTQCPALAMHKARDLLAGWRQTLKKSPKDSGKYLKLMRAYYPGILHCLRSRAGKGKGRNPA